MGVFRRSCHRRHRSQVNKLVAGWLVRVSLHFTPYYSGLLTVILYEAARGSLADN